MANLLNRILLVEDEALVAFMLEDIVQNLGCIPVGPAETISSAMMMLEFGKIDAAILNINIEGKWSFAVADELSRLGKSWIFISDYGNEILDGRYPDVPIVTKPFIPEYISAVILHMLQDQAAGEGQITVAALPPVHGHAAFDHDACHLYFRRQE